MTTSLPRLLESRLVPGSPGHQPTHVGHELIAAGMLIMAGGHDGKPFELEELERWTRVGYERGIRFRKGER
jgi:hypothetical protein